MALGFFEAPFAHSHERENGEAHHAAERAHPHWYRSAAASHGPLWTDIDPAADERPANWFQPIPHAGVSLYVVPGRAGVVPPPVEGERLRPIPRHSSHDPPAVAGLPARAPPVRPA